MCVTDMICLLFVITGYTYVLLFLFIRVFGLSLQNKFDI